MRRQQGCTRRSDAKGVRDRLEEVKQHVRYRLENPA